MPPQCKSRWTWLAFKPGRDTLRGLIATAAGWLQRSPRDRQVQHWPGESQAKRMTRFHSALVLLQGGAKDLLIVPCEDVPVCISRMGPIHGSHSLTTTIWLRCWPNELRASYVWQPWGDSLAMISSPWSLLIKKRSPFLTRKPLAHRAFSPVISSVSQRRFPVRRSRHRNWP